LILRFPLHGFHFSAQGLDSFFFAALFGASHLVAQPFPSIGHPPLQALALALQRPANLLARSLFSLSRLLLGAPNLRLNAGLWTWIAGT
jgi:hypothetical protein